MIAGRGPSGTWSLVAWGSHKTPVTDRSMSRLYLSAPDGLHGENTWCISNNLLGGVVLDSKKNTLLTLCFKLVASLEKRNCLSKRWERNSPLTSSVSGVRCLTILASLQTDETNCAVFLHALPSMSGLHYHLRTSHHTKFPRHYGVSWTGLRWFELLSTSPLLSDTPTGIFSKINWPWKPFLAASTTACNAGSGSYLTTIFEYLNFFKSFKRHFDPYGPFWTPL